MKALDKQTGGNNYKNYKIQHIEFFHANDIGYAESAIIQYVMRFRDKNGLEDLKKAKHMIDILIQLEYPDPVVESVKEPLPNAMFPKLATTFNNPFVHKPHTDPNPNLCTCDLCAGVNARFNNGL